MLLYWMDTVCIPHGRKEKNRHDNPQTTTVTTLNHNQLASIPVAGTTVPVDRPS